MNTNRINKIIAGIPMLKLASQGRSLDVSYMSANISAVKLMNRDAGSGIQIAMVNLAVQMATSADAVQTAKIFVEFLRNPAFRRYVLVTQLRATSKEPRLQDACEKLHWSDERVYAMAETSAELLRMEPEAAATPIEWESVALSHTVMELDKKVELQLDERLALIQTELERLKTPPEEKPEMSVHQLLDNGQKLVKVIVKGKVHYIVVDADVFDLQTAPEIWELINRDELRLSVNCTTDRLRRTTVVNAHWMAGRSVQRIAARMRVPVYIVTSDIRLLRRLGKLGPRPEKLIDDADDERAEAAEQAKTAETP